MSAVSPLASRWQARLELGFERRAEKTVLSRRRHVGPLVIQKPFYPEQGSCHVYLIHPPGGVVGGDKIELDVEVGSKAHALITTPAANKFYRSAGSEADVVQHLRLAEEAVLEWLPQENILFDNSLVNLRTRIELGREARLLAWEMQCLGRPASHEVFRQGHLRQGFELWCDHKPLLIDRSRIDGASDMMQAPWGLAGFGVLGNFILYPAGPAELEQVRALGKHIHAGLRLSASLIGNILVCRALAQQAEPLRELFIRIWQMLRPALLNKPAVLPRIWNT